jgi:hypothetical protein
VSRASRVRGLKTRDTLTCKKETFRDVAGTCEILTAHTARRKTTDKCEASYVGELGADRHESDVILSDSGVRVLAELVIILRSNCGDLGKLKINLTIVLISLYPCGQRSMIEGFRWWHYFSYAF